MSDQRHIDGNGVGGLLAEVLGVDPTTVRRRGRVRSRGGESSTGS
jgi:hypothetical protein